MYRPVHAEEVRDRVLATNLRVVWLCMRAGIPRMLVKGGGAFVNAALILGLVAARNAAYCAAKHAVFGLTKAAALDNATVGLRASAAC